MSDPSEFRVIDLKQIGPGEYSVTTESETYGRVTNTITCIPPFHWSSPDRPDSKSKGRKYCRRWFGYWKSVMCKWLAWYFKIGWKIVYEWIDDDDIIETTWIHKKTDEKRIVRQSITWW